MRFIFSLLFLQLTLYSNAQYPSDSRVISDVKSTNPNEFVEIKTNGNWYLSNDRIPDWEKPNAAERPIIIRGAKNSDGEWWEYAGVAIYHINGASYNFNRVYIFEEPRLSGVKLPENQFFVDKFMNILSSKEQLFMMMNYHVANAINFYSIELAEDPWVTGNKMDRYVIYKIDIVLDYIDGYSIEKRKQTIKVKLNKIDEEYTFKSAEPSGDGEFISRISYPSNDQLREYTKFNDFQGSLVDFIQLNPSYPDPPGYNGNGLPCDDEIIDYIESWAVESSSNFALLFGDRGKTMIIKMELNALEGAQVLREGDFFSKSFTVYYEFINEKTNDMEFFVYGATREIVLKFKIDNDNWNINSFEYKGDTEYTKRDNIAWNYRSGYKEQTFDKTVLKDK